MIRVGKLYCIFTAQSSHIQSHKEGSEWTIVDPEIKSPSTTSTNACDDGNF